MSTTAVKNLSAASIPAIAVPALYEGEESYLALLSYVMQNGVEHSNRTGTDTINSFGHQMRFDLRKGFPLLTTKKLHLRSIIHELLWFLKGETNVKYLQENKVTIWDEWADANGDLGPIYGQQWRDFGGETLGTGKGVDQIKELITRLKTDPNSRRHVVVAWNPMALKKITKSPPPCHALFQFFIADGTLSCQLYQRSADLFLGVPFNIASYSLLLLMIAQECGLKPGEFIHTLGDAHIYSNHMEQVKTQLSRDIRPRPRMTLNPARTSVFDFVFEDFTLSDYNPHPTISAPIAI